MVTKIRLKTLCFSSILLLNITLLYSQNFVANQLLVKVVSASSLDYLYTITNGKIKTEPLLKMPNSIKYSTSRNGNKVSLQDFRKWYIVSFDTQRITDSIASLCKKRSDLFLATHYNFLAKLYDTPAEQFYNLQSNLHTTINYPDANCNVEQAWEYTVGKPTIKIGIFDTGILWSHEDFGDGSFAGSSIKGGYDYYNEQLVGNLSVLDPAGHGTMVAGIIGATRNNNLGISGIAGGDAAINKKGISLYALNIFDDNGSWQSFASCSHIAQAFVDGCSYDPATDYGYNLDIINCSWGINVGDDFYSASNLELLHEVFQYAKSNDVTIIAARGNSGSSEIAIPATISDDYVVSIGASNADGNKWNGSSYGNAMDLLAPGTSDIVLSLANTTTMYNWVEGTSFAAPHATAAAGLLQSYYTDNSTTKLYPEDIEKLLELHTFPINNNSNYTPQNGWGRLNIGNSLEHINPNFYTIYHLQHSIPSSDLQLINSNHPIQLQQNIDNLTTTNTYTADIYQCTTSFPIIVPTGESFLQVWGTASTTSLLQFPTIINKYTGSNLTTNGSTITASGYVYHIIGDANGNMIDQWYPYNPNNSIGNISYTLYTQKQISNIATDIPYFLVDNASKVIAIYDMQGRYIGNNMQAVEASGLYLLYYLSSNNNITPCKYLHLN